MTDDMDNSVYSQITENQERMMIFDVYIMGSIGLTIALIAMYSLVQTKKKLKDNEKNDKYYKYAVNCGIIQCVAVIIFYLLKLLSNDLIIPPIDNLMKNNIMITLGLMTDSFETTAWSIAVVSCYFGFTFIYLSLFEKNKIDAVLKGLMICTAIIIFLCTLLYLIDDVLTESLKEISVTQKRGIYVVTLVNSNSSAWIVIVSFIAMLTDLVYIVLLLYRFISDTKQSSNRYHDGAKAVILYTISSIMFIISVTLFGFELDMKYALGGSLQLLVSNLCLFLMFKENEQIYNDFCGCLCGKCVVSMCFGSKYKAVDTNDDGDDDGDVAVV